MQNMGLICSSSVCVSTWPSFSTFNAEQKVARFLDGVNELVGQSLNISPNSGICLAMMNKLRTPSDSTKVKLDCQFNPTLSRTVAVP